MVPPLPAEIGGLQITEILASAEETEFAPDTDNDPVRPQGKYTIQIVTYKSQQEVDRQVQKLAAKGYHGFVIPSGKFLQVCVNAFSDRYQAVSTLRELRLHGLAPVDAYVRPMNR